MANHKSALKAIRKSEKRRLHNRYYAKTMRNAVRDLKATKEKKDAEAQVSKVCSMIDKLAKTNVIHKNKASNLKSSCMRYVNSLA